MRKSLAQLQFESTGRISSLLSPDAGSSGSSTTGGSFSAAAFSAGDKNSALQPAIGSLLQRDLQLLYVLATRAKRRLVFFEESEGATSLRAK